MAYQKHLEYASFMVRVVIPNPISSAFCRTTLSRTRPGASGRAEGYQHSGPELRLVRYEIYLTVSTRIGVGAGEMVAGRAAVPINPINQHPAEANTDNHDQKRTA